MPRRARTAFLVVRLGSRIGLFFGPERYRVACVTTRDRKSWLAADPDEVRSLGVQVRGDIWALLGNLPKVPHPYSIPLALAAGEQILAARKGPVAAAKATTEKLWPFFHNVALPREDNSAK